jgi:hypothetical protein
VLVAVAVLIAGVAISVALLIGGEDGSTTSPPPTATSPGNTPRPPGAGWIAQFGFFTVPANAVDARDDIRELGIDAKLLRNDAYTGVAQGGQSVYAGPYEQKSEAEAVADGANTGEKPVIRYISPRGE